MLGSCVPFNPLISYGKHTLKYPSQVCEISDVPQYICTINSTVTTKSTLEGTAY